VLAKRADGFPSRSERVGRAAGDRCYCRDGFTEVIEVIARLPRQHPPQPRHEGVEPGHFAWRGRWGQLGNRVADGL
jgi:hypothetical protein